MRDPARKALYCLLALIASAGLIWLGAGREARIGEHWTAIPPPLGILIGSAVLAVFAAVLALATFLLTRRT